MKHHHWLKEVLQMRVAPKARGSQEMLTVKDAVL